MKNYWWRRKRTRVRLHLWLKIYKAHVKPVLTYNASTWGLTAKDTENLNVFHRKQLCKIIGSKASQNSRTISNQCLYAIAKSKPLTVDITASRWRILGHLLRQPLQAPAQRALSYYCREETDCKRFQGNKRATIITTINKNIRDTKNRLPNFTLPPLTNNEQLASFRRIASNRRSWQEITKLVTGTAQGNYPDLIIV